MSEFNDYNRWEHPEGKILPIHEHVKWIAFSSKSSLAETLGHQLSHCISDEYPKKDRPFNTVLEALYNEHL